MIICLRKFSLIFLKIKQTKKESSTQIANEKQTLPPQFDNYYNYDNKDKRLSNLQPSSHNWPSTHTELTNAELRTKLLHMGRSKRGPPFFANLK